MIPDSLLSQMNTLSSRCVVIVVLAYVNKILTMELKPLEIASKYFIHLLGSSRNNDLKCDILKDVIKMENKRYK